MATNKPRIQVILEQDCYNKFKALCKKDDRTESKLGKKIIENYIEQYEQIHGEIKVEIEQ